MAHSAASPDRHPVHEELGGYEGSKLAMWLFLATELLFFAVMFTGLAIFHGKFPEAFKAAHMSLDWRLGGLNTLFLILSSLTVALSLDAIQRGKKDKGSWMLLATIILAGCFLVVKYFEYTGKFAKGIFPGNAAQMADWTAAHGLFDVSHSYVKVPAEMQNGVNLFFTWYFVMTGVHGLHVLIGMGVLGVILVKNMRGRYSHWYYTPVENGALYWHLVDLIWIYLFPLFYLIR